MSTSRATDFPTTRSSQRDEPVTRKLYPLQDSDVSHSEPMTRAEREEFDRLSLALMRGQAEGKRHLNWLFGGVAVITLLGSGANFIGSSGVFVGKTTRDAEIQTERLKKAEERLENLRTLYLIRFGEDPDKVTPETMDHRLKAQEKK